MARVVGFYFKTLDKVQGAQFAFDMRRQKGGAKLKDKGKACKAECIKSSSSSIQTNSVPSARPQFGVRHQPAPSKGAGVSFSWPGQ